VRRSVSGTPQGGVVSPLLCNVYLHRVDRDWRTRGCGVLVRYADDLVVMCRTETEARRALAALRTLLSELGLEPKHAKTRIVCLREGGEGFDFLGFHHRYVRGRTRRSRNITFLARWPSRQAMQHARDRIRELTARERLLLPVEDVVQDVNGFLCGWAGYFRYGNSGRPFDKIGTYALAPALALRDEAPSQAEKLRLADGCLRVAEPARADQPQRTPRCPTAESTVAGEAECRR
jgi:RNA-directed DNA polymerase